MEEVHDLGYRAVIPGCLARELHSESTGMGTAKANGEIFSNVQHITVVIAVILGRMRRIVADCIKKEFPKIAEPMLSKKTTGRKSRKLKKVNKRILKTRLKCD